MNSDRIMRNLMQGMGMDLGMPFAGMFGGFGGIPNPPQMNQGPISSMMPHGFMSPMSMMMMDPFQGMQQAMTMANNTNGAFSYCSSSVTSYTTDEQGRPQVYQQSREIKQGPGGVKETKEAVRDTKSGHQELAIGHHLYDKAHIKKKSRNVLTKEEEQGEEFVNVDESEAESFEQAWARQARNITPAYNQLQYNQNGGRSSRNNRLALASSAQEDLYHPQSHRHVPCTSSGTTEKSAMKMKKKKKSKEARI